MTKILRPVITWLRRLRHRPALLTILSSNGSTISLMLTNFISVPFALHFLSTREFGLWAFTNQSVGYLLLFDLGVSVAVSRLLAGPLSVGNQTEANQWFSLSLLVMTAQGLAMGLVGWFLVSPLLRWFDIPVGLIGEARTLWLWMLGLSIVNYVGQILNGILYAENRLYWFGFGTITGTWVGLASFVFCLAHGVGVLAYAYSSAVQTIFVCCLPWLGVKLGSNRFRLNFNDLGLKRLRQLYSFSGALFVIQIANAIMLSGQTLIVTKLFGLEGAAGYNVCSKLFLAARALAWQLYQSFLPGWQQLYLKGKLYDLIGQWRLRFDLLLSATVAGVIVFIAGNRWFVNIWAKPELYQGFGFDFAAGLFCVVIIFVSIFAFPQTFAMRLWLRSFLQMVAAGFSIVIGIVFARFFGIPGVFWGGTISLLVVAAGYNIRQFKVLLLKPAGASFSVLQWKWIRSLAAFVLSAAVIGATQQYSNPVQITVDVIVMAANLVLFFLDWKHSLINLITGHRLTNESSASHKPQI